MASNSLRGHGGQRHTAYNLRTNELRLHVKFQPPRFTGLAVHRSQAEGQTKRGLTNICLDQNYIYVSTTKINEIHRYILLVHDHQKWKRKICNF